MTTSGPPSGEDRLFDWLRANVPGGEHLGDDAVVLEESGPIALSVDQQIEGVHFPTGLDPAWLARRLLEVCLSDLAATAARPRRAVLALAAPENWPHRQFLAALADALRGREMELVGGDTARDERVRLALWVMGDRPATGRFVSRRGAEPGDRLWIGGHPGWSALGRQVAAAGGRPQGRGLALPDSLRSPRSLARAARHALRAHLAPVAQLELGRWLGRRRRSAAIDISDGFSLDLHRLCRASGVGARVDVERLVRDPQLDRLASELDLSTIDLVCGGGEDYLLLFFLPPSARPPEPLGAISIGTATDDGELRHATSGKPLAATGWSHLSS